MTTCDDIARVLARHQPTLLDLPGHTRAAVAMVMRPAADHPEMLFIERAPHDADPWSGDIGFPGGKVETADHTPREAAERETREEIGLDLRSSPLLGRLSDIAGAHLPVLVSCFVFAVGDAGQFRLSDEVRDAFWVPLPALRDPLRHGDGEVRFGGELLSRPAIRLPVPDKPVLWGITYRLVMQLISLLEGRG